MKRILMAVVLAAVPWVAFALPNMAKTAYGEGVKVTSAMLDGSATTLTVTSATVVSSTAINITGTDVLVAFECDQTTALAILPNNLGPITLTSSTGFRLSPNQKQVLTVPASATTALIAGSSTASCNLQRMRR